MRELAVATVVRMLHLLRVGVDLVGPLVVAFALISALTNPALIDVAELRANSLLMSARPIFRVVAPGDELRVALGNSAILLAAAVGGAIAISVPAGIAYAWSRNAPLKAFIWATTTFAASLPAFFWAVVLELGAVAIYFRTGLRPLPIAGFGIDEHLVLPALALGLRPAAYIFRLTAVAVEDIRHQDYVRTGVAKGLPDRPLLVRHVLPNAQPAIIAAIVLGARGALSSLLIVEFVYIWGGAGTLFVQTLAQRRLELAVEIALAFALGSVLLDAVANAARARTPAPT